MAAQGRTTTSPLPRSGAAQIFNPYQEGIIAGLIGAATIALWFLVLDLFTGRAFYTPTLLGTALFRSGEGLDSPETLPSSLEMVLMFTWVHVLIFCILGGVVSWLLGVAEKNSNLGFGILLFFVFFMFGFVVFAMIFAQPILQALTWPTILIGNLLAAATMGAYFWKRHPHLIVRP